MQNVMTVAVRFARLTALFTGLAVALMTGYVVKSALGINVFAGRSPIVHDLLYPAAVALKATVLAMAT
jgi:hypothetical protein